MRRAALSMLLPLALSLAACANGGPQPFVPDTARLAPGELGVGPLDQDVPAVYFAAWAFAVPSRTYNDPADAARACADLDYLAGELYTSPRWANLGALTKEQVLRGRAEERQALGIPPDAPSQLVVDGLASVANAYAAGNQAAALDIVSRNPAFPNPQATLARLPRLPYMQMANVGLLKAQSELFGPGNLEFDE